MDLLSELDLPDFLTNETLENIEDILFTYSIVRTNFIEWLLVQSSQCLKVPLLKEDNGDCLSKLEQLRLALISLQVAPENRVLPFLQCSNEDSQKIIDTQIWGQLFTLAYYNQKNNSQGGGDIRSSFDDNEAVLKQIVRSDEFSRLRRKDFTFDHFPAQTSARRHDGSKNYKSVIAEKSAQEILQLAKTKERELKQELRSNKEAIDIQNGPSNMKNVSELICETESTIEDICSDIDTLVQNVKLFESTFGIHELVRKKQSKQSRSFSELGSSVLTLSKAQNQFKEHLSLNRRLNSAIMQLHEKVDLDASAVNESVSQLNESSYE